MPNRGLKKAPAQTGQLLRPSIHPAAHQRQFCWSPSRQEMLSQAQKSILLLSKGRDEVLRKTFGGERNGKLTSCDSSVRSD